MKIEMLFANYYESASVILFCIGFAMLLLQRNLIKKVMGLNIMDTSVYLFLASKGYISGRGVPISSAGASLDPAACINPLPCGLVLTGIVVSVSVSAILLALIQKFHRYYGTVNLDDMLFRD